MPKIDALSIDAYQFTFFSFSTMKISLSNASISLINVAQGLLHSKINRCCFVQTLPPAIGFHKYIIDYDPIFFDVRDFEFIPDNLCLDSFPFWYYTVSSPPIPSPSLPIMFHDEPLALSFLLDSVNVPLNQFNVVGTVDYSITIKGTLPNFQVTQTSWFVI